MDLLNFCGCFIFRTFLGGIFSNSYPVVLKIKLVWLVSKVPLGEYFLKCLPDCLFQKYCLIEKCSEILGDER